MVNGECECRQRITEPSKQNKTLLMEMNESVDPRLSCTLFIEYMSRSS